MAMTGDQVKQKFFREGRSFAQFARENDYPYWLVVRLVNGAMRGTRGKAHECAVKLGLKDREVTA